MLRLQLDRDKWKRVRRFLTHDRKAGRKGKNDRRFIEAVLWWRRTGVPWRDLPPQFGPWKTVFNRFDNWSKSGKWDRLMKAMQTDVDGEWHCIDSTINRAHQHSAGGKGGPRRMGSAVVVEASRARFT